MSHRFKSGKLLRFTPRLLGLAVATAGLVAGLFAVQERWTARYWQMRLDAAAEEDAPELVREIAAAGDRGIAVLVAGLASPRESVCREVRLVLDEEMNRWARLPRGQASVKLGLLAAALAEKADKFDATSRLFAADLVSRILLWPTDESVLQRSQLVADCEQTLRLASLKPDQQSQRWQRRADAVRSAQIAADLRPSPLPVVGTDSLPLEKLAPPELPPMPTALDLGSAQPQTAGSGEAPRRLTTSQSAARRLSSPSAALHAAANQAAYLADESPEASTAQAGGDLNSARGDKLQSQEATDLFAQLSQEGAAAAEAELTRRGFSRREIEAGKHLASADADERRRWTEALPGMRGIDVKNWLLWLSRDPDAAVRRAAVTLMATSQDPQLLRRVEQVSREDADPEIRAQAARSIAGDSKSPAAGYAR